MQQSANGASNLAPEDALPTQPDVFFLVANGLGGVYDALHKSAQDYDDSALSTVPLIATWAITLTVMSIISTVLVIFIIVKPTVWRVEDEKQDIIFLFMDLPPAVLSRFIMKCQTRLSYMEKMATGGGREVGDLDALDNLDEYGESEAASMTGESVNSAGHTVASSKLSGTALRQHASQHTHRRRTR
jgi:hypothetical protein